MRVDRDAGAIDGCDIAVIEGERLDQAAPTDLPDQAATPQRAIDADLAALENPKRVMGLNAESAVADVDDGTE